MFCVTAYDVYMLFMLHICSILGAPKNPGIQLSTVVPLSIDPSVSLRVWFPSWRNTKPPHNNGLLNHQPISYTAWFA